MSVLKYPTAIAKISAFVTSWYKVLGGEDRNPLYRKL